jgi:hypothetical protein
LIYYKTFGNNYFTPKAYCTYWTKNHVCLALYFISQLNWTRVFSRTPNIIATYTY